MEPDKRRHYNIVFIGHVDAGKSTTCGNILYLGGCVDERAIEKYQREAKDKNRDSWFLAYIMDTSEEEKAKGNLDVLTRATSSVSQEPADQPKRQFNGIKQTGRVVPGFDPPPHAGPTRDPPRCGMDAPGVGFLWSGLHLT